MSPDKTIQLDHPITIDGGEVAQLTMRRPKVRDQLLAEKHDGSEAEKELAIFANLCGVPPESLHELDLADYFKLQEAYQGFFASRAATSVESA